MLGLSSYPERVLSKVVDEYDYIILGGGTAGCVVANRLSEAGFTVLVVERGAIGDSWISRIPLFSQAHQSTDGRVISFKSTPQKHADNRTLDLMAGNSLGGGSKINAMLYTRGLPAEYNAWAAAGRKGWAYGDLREFFVKSEKDLDQPTGITPKDHGVRGEWLNRSHQDHHWGHTAYIRKATSQLGLPYIEDLNSPSQPAQGCAKMHFNIDAQGHRSSTYSAFLPRQLVEQRRDRLHVCTNTAAVKIEIEEEKGAWRARSVILRSIKNKSPDRSIRARHEIVLCSGAFGSPQILMLSGIGPAEHLKEHDIPVVKDLPAVGSHLQDHTAVPLQYSIPLHDSLVKFRFKPWTIIKEFILYLLFGTGLLLGQVLEVSIFALSRLLDQNSEQRATEKDQDASLPESLPDIEIMPIANGEHTSLQKSGRGGLSFFVVNLRPTSTGTVRLANKDPLTNPIVDLNVFAAQRDWEVMRKGMKLGMRIGKEMAASGYDIVGQFLPKSEEDADLDEFIREYCYSTLHYSSTCRMAPERGRDDGDGDGGVVDDRLRVHGVKGLRVADASVFPEILGTHLAAPTVVVAEKCASMIIQDHGAIGREADP